MASARLATLKKPAVSWSPRALQQIRTQAIEGLLALPQRGMEVGGLLLGSVSNQEPYWYSIDSVAPIECEHQFGPGFSLSDNDRRRLVEQLAEIRGCSDHCVVGYFRSRTAREAGPEFDQADRELIGKFFAEPSHMFLAVRPWSVRRCEAALYHWSGGFLAAAGVKFELGEPPPFQASTVEQDPVVLAPLESAPPVVARPSIKPLVANSRQRSEQFWKISTITLAVLAVFLMFSPQGARIGSGISPDKKDAPPVAVEVSGNRVELSWDPAKHRIDFAPVKPTGGSLKLTLLPAQAQDTEPLGSPNTPPSETLSDSPEEPIVQRALALDMVRPVIPDSIRNRISEPITVKVIAQVNQNGRVISAKPAEYAGGLERYLAQQAADAARTVRFRPAMSAAGLPLAASEELTVTVAGR
jgi:hypothetical protein